jgi:hypothetical protein
MRNTERDIYGAANQNKDLF